MKTYTARLLNPDCLLRKYIEGYVRSKQIELNDKSFKCNPDNISEIVAEIGARIVLDENNTWNWWTVKHEIIFDNDNDYTWFIMRWG